MFFSALENPGGGVLQLVQRIKKFHIVTKYRK